MKNEIKAPADWTVMVNFKSKKNRVQLIRESSPNETASLYVLKQFKEKGRADREAHILRLLAGKCAVPALMGQDDDDLRLEYISGETLADWLEAAEEKDPSEVSLEVREKMKDLAAWLKCFYGLLQEAIGEPVVMGDVNLRNFIVSDRLSGVDFEEVSPGNPVQDLGSIAAFIRMYEPENTPWKQELADFWLKVAAEEFSLTREELKREMERELQAMQIRRPPKKS